MPPMYGRFNFNVGVDNVFKEIKNLCMCKATHSNDFPVKNLQQNTDIF